MNPALNIGGPIPVGQPTGMIPMVPALPYLRDFRPGDPTAFIPAPVPIASHTLDSPSRSRSRSRSRSYRHHSHHSHHHGRSRSRSRSRSRHHRHHHRHHSRSSSRSSSSSSRSPSSHGRHKSGHRRGDDDRRSRRAPSPEAVLPDGTKVLFVGCLSSDVSQEDLRKAFSAFGTVSRVELKESFAYIYMATGGTRAHDEMDGVPLGQSRKRIRVEWSQTVLHGRVEGSIPNETLYVADYDPSTTAEELKTVFEPFGKIVRVTPYPKFTFIEYERMQDAEAAHAQMQNKKVGSRTWTVQYARPEPRRKANKNDIVGSEGSTETTNSAESKEESKQEDSTSSSSTGTTTAATAVSSSLPTESTV